MPLQRNYLVYSLRVLVEKGLVKREAHRYAYSELCDVEKLKKVSGRGVESEHLGTEAFEENVAAEKLQEQIYREKQKSYCDVL